MLGLVTFFPAVFCITTTLFVCPSRVTSTRRETASRKSIAIFCNHHHQFYFRPDVILIANQQTSLTTINQSKSRTHNWIESPISSWFALIYLLPKEFFCRSLFLWTFLQKMLSETFVWISFIKVCYTLKSTSLVMCLRLFLAYFSHVNVYISTICFASISFVYRLGQVARCNATWYRTM